MEINTTKYKNCKEFVQTKLLNQYDFANLFNVVKLGEKSYFNICKTITFENVNDVPPSLYYLYTLNETDSWTGISYKFYETIRLWWLICKFNNIIDPFKELTTGKIIKVPSLDFAKQILRIIETQ